MTLLIVGEVTYINAEHSKKKLPFDLISFKAKGTPIFKILISGYSETIVKTGRGRVILSSELAKYNMEIIIGQSEYRTFKDNVLNQNVPFIVKHTDGTSINLGTSWSGDPAPDYTAASSYAAARSVAAAAPSVAAAAAPSVAAAAPSVAAAAAPRVAAAAPSVAAAAAPSVAGNLLLILHNENLSDKIKSCVQSKGINTSDQLELTRCFNDKLFGTQYIRDTLLPKQYTPIPNPDPMPGINNKDEKGDTALHHVLYALNNILYDLSKDLSKIHKNHNGVLNYLIGLIQRLMANGAKLENIGTINVTNTSISGVGGGYSPYHWLLEKSAYTLKILEAIQTFTWNVNAQRTTSGSKGFLGFGKGLGIKDHTPIQSLCKNMGCPYKDLTPILTLLFEKGLYVEASTGQFDIGDVCYTRIDRPMTNTNELDTILRKIATPSARRKDPMLGRVITNISPHELGMELPSILPSGGAGRPPPTAVGTSLPSAVVGGKRRKSRKRTIKRKRRSTRRRSA